jgi:hypothetical protein
MPIEENTVSKLERRRPIFYKRRRGLTGTGIAILIVLLVGGGAFLAWRLQSLTLVASGALPDCDSVQAQSRFNRLIDSLPALLGPRAVPVSVDGVHAAPDARPDDRDAHRCVADLRVGAVERRVRFDIVPGIVAGERFALRILPQAGETSSLGRL